MRHWFLTAALFVALAVSDSRADYVIIRIIVNQAESTTQPDPKNPTGQPPLRQPPSGQPPLGQPPTGQPPLRQPPGGKPPVGKQPASLQPDDYVIAVVELKGAPKSTKTNPPVLFLEHRWGRTAYYEDSQIQLQLVSPKVLKTPLVQFKERSEALANSDDRNPDRYLELAFWCLEVGLPDMCHLILNQLEKMTAGMDADKLSVKVKRAVEAYKQIKPILDADAGNQDKANAWKQRLRYSSVAASKHYAMVHNSDDPVRDGVQRRLAALEYNFKTFYLLFALKGKALPAPSAKLTAILAADNAAFSKARQTFEITELTSDAFHGRQENLAVFAPNRIDKTWGYFEQEMRAIYNKHQVNLLKGQFPDFGKMPEDLEAKVNQVKRAQVFALAEAALQEESEIAAATHEGSRQLFAETGLLPRNTAAPEWLRFGLASLFEMPKGPFPGKSTSMLKMAFWPGAGGPNWAWRRYFDEMVQDHLIPDQPTELLWKTLTGYWFDHARDLQAAPKEEGGKDPTEAAQTEMARGRCLSWALTYYLFTERFDEMMAFLNDLANLPRDVELDQFLFLTTFCKAFHIDTNNLTATDLKGNLSAYDELAKNWNMGLKRVAIPTVKLSLEDSKPVDPKGTGPTGFGPKN